MNSNIKRKQCERKTLLPNEAFWLLFLVNPPAECVTWWQTGFTLRGGGGGGGGGG